LFGSFLGPEVGFGVRLGEDTWGADEVPGREGEAGIGVGLLGGDVLERC